MSTSPPETHANHLLDSTPSQESRETPGWARLVGLVGVVCFGAGVLMYAWNANVFLNIFKGPKFVEGTSLQSDPWLFSFVHFFILVGLVGMLLQLSREREMQQRRLLGMLGTVIFALGVLFLTNVLVSEGIKNWIAGPELTGTEGELARARAQSQARWGGLAATIVMAITLLVAWVAPFVRAANPTRVSLWKLLPAWFTRMGEARISAMTLFGAIALAVLVAVAFLLKDPMASYSDVVLGYVEVNRLAYGLCSYALLFMLMGLPFLLIFARTEEDEAWSRIPGSLFATVGTLAAAAGLFAVLADLLKIPDYALPYGFGLSLFGLVLLGLYIGQRGGDSETGYRVARWTAFAGVVVLILAAVRSLLPSLVEMPWLQDWFPRLEDMNLSSYLVPSGFLFLVLGGLYFLLGSLLASDNKFLVLTRRELGSFFISPIGYIVLAGIAIVSWIIFYTWVYQLARSTLMGGMPEPVVQSYFFDWFMVIILMIAVPMLTMRLFSEENRSGTMEVLLTAPVSEISIVLSKFLAAWIFTVLLFTMWLVFPLLLRIAGQETFDFRPMLSAMLGLSAITFGFVSMGIFFSSLTKNQIVAMLLTFAGMLAMFMLWFISRTLMSDQRGPAETPLSDALLYINFVDHMLTFSTGKVYWKHLLFHFSFGIFWLFLTVRVLESRKWR